jgi:5,10-methylenetetrahydrofolate reductase
MFDYPYLVEILTPKRSTPQEEQERMEVFSQRYRRILDAGLGLSMPDNPMGRRRLSAVESIRAGSLPVDPEKTVMNLNTFHTKQELDGLLREASETGVRHLLIVRGDGGPELPKLDPGSIGGKLNIATSADLLRYINTEYTDRFVTGAAFNPYNRMPLELDRFKQKQDAGAWFAVTQPVIGKDPNVDQLFELGVPVVVEAWMSKNVDLLYKSVRKEKEEGGDAYDPGANLAALHQAYPESCIYLSMLSFKQDWKGILPML